MFLGRVSDDDGEINATGNVVASLAHKAAEHKDAGDVYWVGRETGDDLGVASLQDYAILDDLPI